jgi:hypothetical protein
MMATLMSCFVLLLVTVSCTTSQWSKPIAASGRRLSTLSEDWVCIWRTYLFYFFYLLKGPAADATDAPRPWRLIVQPCDKDEVFSAFPFWWSTGGMKLTGENRSTRRKSCPSITLSTTNLTWNDLGSSPGLRGERPATNRLSHSTAPRTTYTGHEPRYIPSEEKAILCLVLKIEKIGPVAVLTCHLTANVFIN